MIARTDARIARNDVRTDARTVVRTGAMTDAMTDAIKSSGRNKSGKTNGIFARITAGRTTGIPGAVQAQGMTCTRADAFPENIEAANMSSTTGAATV